jgi:hypothetical protein
MDVPIKNITDLRSEILRLKEVEQQQSIALGLRFKTFSSTMSTLMTIFPRPVGSDGTKSSGFFDQDLVGLISRFVLPFTLNKTLFRNSGFIVKAIVGLVSQKASHFITEDSVVGVWDKAKAIFKNFTSKKEHEQTAHKGVPPLSEAS